MIEHANKCDPYDVALKKYLSEIQARFGARLLVTSKYSKNKMNSEQISKQSRCIGGSVSASYGALSGKAEANHCKESENESKQGSKNSASSTRITSYGSKPKKDPIGLLCYFVPFHFLRKRNQREPSMTFPFTTSCGTLLVFRRQNSLPIFIEPGLFPYTAFQSAI